MRSAPLSLERLEERTLLSAVPIPNDSSSLLLLRFESEDNGGSCYYVCGENGEGPISGGGDGLETAVPGLIGDGFNQEYSGNLTYANAGNILSTRGTVEFWFDPRGSSVPCGSFCPPAWNGNDGKFHPFFEAGDNSTKAMLIAKDASNNLRFTQWGDDPATPAVETNVERSIATSAADVHPGRWYHVAATWDGASRQMALYVDGQLRGSRSDGVVINQFSPVNPGAFEQFVFSVGWEQENGQNAGIPNCEGCAAPAAAAMDEFRISNRARSATEIRNDYDLGAGNLHLVRVAYLVPSDRTAQSHAVSSLQNNVRWYQSFFRDYMDRNGFGPKTFTFETEADGVTPKIHVVQGPDTAEYYRTDPWDRVVAALQEAGLPIFSAAQVWFSVYEGHVQMPDGSVSGHFLGGGSFGSGSDGGQGLVSSDLLAFMKPANLVDDRLYDGLIEPDLGPYPMQYSSTPPFTFVDYVGDTISKISSSVQGGSLHEITHAFGLPHDVRHGDQFGLMGNGHRKFRGWVHPDRYPDVETGLEYASALALSTSRYFNPPQSYTDNVAPSLSVLTTGAVNPVNGLLRISFSASDPSGLASAFLEREGHFVAELPLTGTSVNTSIETSFYEPGVSEEFAVWVYDTQGNAAS